MHAEGQQKGSRSLVKMCRDCCAGTPAANGTFFCNRDLMCYSLILSPLNQTLSLMRCLSAGGQLVAYQSFHEQLMVEQVGRAA
jgi:hypothetical protein